MLRLWGIHSVSPSTGGPLCTITRIDEDGGWGNGFWLRAYLPTDTIPDFTSTVYTYWGLDNEKAPKDTTKIIIHPSVTTIQEDAFIGCTSLVRITIPDTVTHIEDSAFCDCVSLRFIRLSNNLQYIGMWAFLRCTSLEAVFLSPTVTHIDDYAFVNCTSLIFCILPDPIEYVVMRSSVDVIDYPPQSSTTCPKYATALPSLLNQFKNAWIHTELNVLRRLMITR